MQEGKHRIGIPFLLSCIAAIAQPLYELGRLFELLLVHAFAAKAALDNLDGKYHRLHWSDVVPTLFSRIVLAKRILFNLGTTPFVVRYPENLKELLTDPSKCNDLCNTGAIVGKENSTTCDLAYVQEMTTRDNNTSSRAIMQWQSTLNVAKKSVFNWKRLCHEVEKGHGADQPVVLTIMRAKFGGELLNVINRQDGRVLVLFS
jgi:hypothetical protein